MTWTSENPTVPGLYLVVHDPHPNHELTREQRTGVVQIKAGLDGLVIYLHGVGLPFALDAAHGRYSWWSEPIRPPD